MSNVNTLNIPQEDFERLLVKIVNQDQASALFAIPGVWDIVSNDPDYVSWVMQDWQTEQKEGE